jgi:nucleoside-diphosphate-sugar epimerase
MADLDCVRRLFREVEPDVVFHLSGRATASPGRDLVLPTLHTLLVSTVNVLVAAADAGCRRVVLAASLTEPQIGGSEITPGSPYAAAKWASGAYARMFHALYQLPVVMVRPFMTYGPAQDKGKLLPYVIVSLLNGQAPKLSSGNQEFDWIYIDDVIDGFLAAARQPNVEGCTIDLGSGSLTSMRTVIEQLTASMKPAAKPLFGALSDRPLESPRRANVEDAWMRLRWRARTPLEQGLEQTIRWFRERAGCDRPAGH